jgi:hypothetical protein
MPTRMNSKIARIQRLECNTVRKLAAVEVLYQLNF